MFIRIILFGLITLIWCCHLIYRIPLFRFRATKSWANIRSTLSILYLLEIGNFWCRSIYLIFLGPCGGFEVGFGISRYYRLLFVNELVWIIIILWSLIPNFGSFIKRSTLFQILILPIWNWRILTKLFALGNSFRMVG